MHHGSSFVGFLPGSDALWASGENFRNVINILFLMKEVNNSTENFPEKLKREVSRILSKNFHRFPKLSYEIRRSKTFPYYLKNRIDLSEYITVIELDGLEPLSQSELEKIVTSYADRSFPKNNTALWEIIIFSKPVIMLDQNENYVVLWRFSHCAGDGLALTTTITNIFGNDTGFAKRNDLNRIYGIKQVRNENVLNKLKRIAKHTHIFLMSPFILIRQINHNKPDTSFSREPAFCGERTLMYEIEDKPRFMEYVKIIKNVVPGTTFSEIVMTTISGSLYTYLRRVRNRKEL